MDSRIPQSSNKLHFSQLLDDKPPTHTLKKIPVDPTETDHLCKVMNAQTKVKYLRYWNEFVQFFIVSFTKASFFRFLIPYQGADLKGPCYATLWKTDFEVVNDDLKEKNSTYMFFQGKKATEKETNLGLLLRALQENLQSTLAHSMKMVMSNQR